MKTTKSTAEVHAQLKSLADQVHEICVANNIPYVASFVLADDSEKLTMANSAYCDAKDAPAPNKMIAAIELLAGPEIDEALPAYLIERNRNGGECDCETCTEERQASAH